MVTPASSVATLLVLVSVTSATLLSQTAGQETNIASAGSDGGGDDRFAAALAIEQTATLVTSDSDFRKLGTASP